MNKYFNWTFFVLLITLIAVSIYTINKTQKTPENTTKITSSPQPKAPQDGSLALPTNAPAPSPTPFIISSNQTQNAIKTNVNSKNYQGLIAYMSAPKVNFSLMSSECCEPQTPEETASQLNYIDDGLPLDFNQESETIKNLKAKNPELADALVGISQKTEHLAAFYIDSQNKISQIQLAVTWKLYNQ